MHWAADVPCAEGWLLVSNSKVQGSPSNKAGQVDRYVVLLPDGLLKCFAGKPPNRANFLPQSPGPGVESADPSPRGSPHTRTAPSSPFDIPKLPLASVQDKHLSPHMSPRAMPPSDRLHANPSPSPFQSPRLCVPASPRLPQSARLPARSQDAPEDPGSKGSASARNSPQSARQTTPQLLQAPKVKPLVLDFPSQFPGRPVSAAKPQIRESPRTGQSSGLGAGSPLSSFQKSSHSLLHITNGEMESNGSMVIHAPSIHGVPRISSFSGSSASLLSTRSCPPPQLDGRSLSDSMPRAESEMIDRSGMYPDLQQAAHRRVPSLDAREPTAEVFFFPPGSEISPLSGNRITLQHRPTQSALSLTAHTATDHVLWLRALRKAIPKTPTAGSSSPHRAVQNGAGRAQSPAPGPGNGGRAPGPESIRVPRLTLVVGELNGGLRPASARETQHKSPRGLLTAQEQAMSSPRGGSERVSTDHSPRPPRVSIADFQLKSCVGTGKFGTVFKVQALFDQQVYAMKVIKKCELRRGSDADHATYDDVLRELRCMQRMRHPFIVPLLASFQTAERLFIVMPFLSGGEIFTMMKRLCWKEETLRVHGAQLVLALDYMHGLGIVYRDMKPENVILDQEGNCLLADFGLAVDANSIGHTCSLGGTNAYMAPEVYSSKATDRIVSAGDWWGVGCVLFEMATGMHPFILPCGTIDVEAAQTDDPNLLGLAEGADVSDAFIDLIFSFLEKSPAKRLCGKESIARHRFFRGVDWDGVLAKRVKPQFDGELWGSVVDSMVGEDDRFDQACCSLKAELEPSPAGDPLPGFDFLSEELRSRMT